jgi:hypothetical protein
MTARSQVRTRSRRHRLRSTDVMTTGSRHLPADVVQRQTPPLSGDGEMCLAMGGASDWA